MPRNACPLRFNISEYPLRFGAQPSTVIILRRSVPISQSLLPAVCELKLNGFSLNDNLGHLELCVLCLETLEEFLQSLFANFEIVFAVIVFVFAKLVWIEA